jgi:hypothetical protein
MKQSYFLLLLITILLYSCNSKSPEAEKVNIQGAWQVDSIQTFENHELVNTHIENPAFIKFYHSEEKIHYCGTTEQESNGYEITEKDDKLIYKVITPEHSLESVLTIIDEDHISLKHLKDNGTENGNYTLWFNSRIKDGTIDNFCHL